jgi:acetylornithine deacetylase
VGPPPYSLPERLSDMAGFDTVVVNYGTDIPNLDGKHKRYLYGPGSILVAHSDHEHLTAGDLEEAVEGYKKLMIALLDR